MERLCSLGAGVQRGWRQDQENGNEKGKRIQNAKEADLVADLIGVGLTAKWLGLKG